MGQPWPGLAGAAVGNGRGGERGCNNDGGVLRVELYIYCECEVGLFVEISERKLR